MSMKRFDSIGCTRKYMDGPSTQILGGKLESVFTYFSKM